MQKLWLEKFPGMLAEVMIYLSQLESIAQRKGLAALKQEQRARCISPD